MDNGWDQAYNPQSLSQVQLLELRAQELRNMMQDREERLGEFEVPPIDAMVVRQNFPRWGAATLDEYHSFLAPWSANRTVWICHNCGSFGYKYSARELFKCYCCRSRNVQVCKSGDLSLVMRAANIFPGINMNQVYQARRERLRQRRRHERSVRNSVH